MFEIYTESDVVKDNPELRNITFEREIGFNITAIDPMTSNIHIAEKYRKKELIISEYPII